MDECPYCSNCYETCVCDLLPHIEVASTSGDARNLAAFLEDAIEETIDLGNA